MAGDSESRRIPVEPHCRNRQILRCPEQTVAINIMNYPLTFALQALLARHEAYMADAERDRLELTTRIERLEMDKQTLEADNATRIEENRHLLDQLEMLNTTVSDSDAKIKSLEASLLSSQQTIRRLEVAADRAADAERHLALLEDEQQKLHMELRSTKEDARSHSQRCKEAQRGILDMQDQLERIEIEARQEQDRHAEVISRMERQREVEKQLDTAAGRLKGAAASKQIQDSKGGSNVVGHFVRDLLQDNAGLQLGIAELREMLMNSNDEVQALREQLMHHQPMEEDMSAHSTLKAELEPAEDHTTPKLSQELHIHHHYHVSPKQDKKPKKKRQVLTSGIFTPPMLSGSSTPAAAGQWRLAQSPAPPTLLTAARDATPTMSMPNTNNWGVFSNPPSEFASSVPSSPRSNQRNSMFDNGFLDTDIPTSPTTSFDPMSPTWRTSHSKRASEASALSFQTFSHLDATSGPPAPVAPQHTYPDDTIHEEDEDAQHLEIPGLMDHGTSIEDSTTEGSEMSRDDYLSRPRLHRAVSHESIMSLSGGLDIHTLKARPSQMTLRPLGGADAVVTGVTAHPTLSRGSNKRSDAALRDNFAGLQTPRSNSGSLRSLSPSNVGSLGKWTPWRLWGNSGPSGTSTARNTPRPADRESGRPTGINQAGSIPGFQQYWAAQKRKGAPANVTTEAVDRDALQDGLQEGLQQ